MKNELQPELKSTETVLILFGVVCSLFLREWIRQLLLQGGHSSYDAKHLSALAAFPLLVLLTAPIIGRNLQLIRRWFSRHWFNLHLLGFAILTGLLLRITFWSGTTFLGSSGLRKSTQATSSEPALVWFNCPEPSSLWIAVLTLVCLTPILEELFHRGFLVSAFQRHGRTTAILMSAVFFTLMHRPETYWIVFIAGIVFAVQFWNSGTLWLPAVTHATFNGLSLLDWHCLKIVWNPVGAAFSMLSLVSFGITVACLLLLTQLLRQDRVEALFRPRPDFTRERLPPVR